MFKEGTCPKCHQVIQVPDDREKVICMYCGEEILVDEALGAGEEARETDPAIYREYYEKAQRELEQVIRTCHKPMEKLKRICTRVSSRPIMRPAGNCSRRWSRYTGTASTRRKVFRNWWSFWRRRLRRNWRASV